MGRAEERLGTQTSDKTQPSTHSCMVSDMSVNSLCCHSVHHREVMTDTRGRANNQSATPHLVVNEASVNLNESEEHQVASNEHVCLQHTQYNRPNIIQDQHVTWLFSIIVMKPDQRSTSNAGGTQFDPSRNVSTINGCILYQSRNETNTWHSGWISSFPNFSCHRGHQAHKSGGKWTIWPIHLFTTKKSECRRQFPALCESKREGLAYGL